MFPGLLFYSRTISKSNDNILYINCFLGRTAILHVLLEIRKIFNAGEFRYLFNQLFINDYCLWIQSVNETVIADLLNEFYEAKKKVDKFSTGLDLEVVEADAEMKLLQVKSTGDTVVEVLESVLDSEDRQEKEEIDSDDEPA